MNQEHLRFRETGQCGWEINGAMQTTAGIAVIAAQFEWAMGFFEELGAVQLDGKYG
jgi:hypothetical protein